MNREGVGKRGEMLFFDCKISKKKKNPDTKMLHRCDSGKKIKLKLLEFNPKRTFLPAEVHIAFDRYLILPKAVTIRSVSEQLVATFNAASST